MIQKSQNGQNLCQTAHVILILSTAMKMSTTGINISASDGKRDYTTFAPKFLKLDPFSMRSAMSSATYDPRSLLLMSIL
jgi:hypothetical protein